MAKSLALLAVVIISVGISAAAAQSTECNKPNEEKRCVQSCPPQKTCQNMDIQVVCKFLLEQCKNRCVCKAGFFRNAGGECVTRDYCTMCGGQNEYYSCRVQPDQTCAAPEADTTADQNSGQCKEQCYCNPGTVRDENDVCVPTDQCNKPCGVDETKDYCPADCASDSCPKGPKTVACARPNVCPPPQCKCRFNHRRAENGTCIPTRECPPFKCDQANEEYDPCPPLCPNGSCSQATPSGDCPPIVGNIGIVLECNPSCRCKKGYFWNEDKVCVPYNQCPGKSDSNASE
ncbi:zonadhesin-like isoform X2 [Leguminivora glycinivorella]|uniref:zonadhesin-like isoform X2 n=1 Tax=Leguminivora glycinivorella TaxID=1035111 RepID=UPI00200E39C1|nr:zonadhesin-like isoform X2 [Leguminivora glycinivorella]